MNIPRKQDYTDETILTTPLPRASSTIQKPQTTKKLELQQIPLVYSPNASSSTESLGILSMDNIEMASELDTASVQNTKRYSQVTNEKLQQQRALANSLLQKTATTRFGLSSRYFKVSDSIRDSVGSVARDSTVNETDLLQRLSDVSFTPDDISTPRTSCASDESISPRNSLGHNTSMSKNIADFSQQLRNSDASLAELCEQFRRLSSLGSDFIQIEGNEESFVPGELAGAKIAEQEQVWQKKHDFLGGILRSDSMFSQVDFGSGQESMLTEFFQKKSELADLCLTTSPEKPNALVPLIDESVLSTVTDVSIEQSELNTQRVMELLDDSLLSVTEMENEISAGDTTATVADYIQRVLRKKTPKMRSSDFKENQKPSKAPEDFESLVNFPTPTKGPRDPLKEMPSFEAVSLSRPGSSMSSVRTASSLENLPDGKLPIQVNRMELVWGCVRVGKRKTQSFILRNKSHNKLRFQIFSSNTNFRILNDHSESDSVSVLPVLMYPLESRGFTVVFAPTSIGAVVDKLKFTPIDAELQLQQTKRQHVMLYAYGGHSNVETENVLKDTNLKMWLSLGKLDNRQELSQTFVVRNSGSVAAFGCLNYNSKALYGYFKVNVYPKEFVLHPKENMTITVTYIPTKEDTKHLFAKASSLVTEIGFIQVITGEEPVRGRIRRLCKKLKQDSGTVAIPLIEKLSNKFPNENMPSDIGRFTETIGCVKELMQTFNSSEIILTLEKDNENTFLEQVGGINETSMFHSLSESTMTELLNNTLVKSCRVEPNKLLLTPPKKTEDCILISSQRALQFQINVMPPDILKVSPSEGILKPGQTILIQISCGNISHLKKQQDFKVFIYVDNDVFEVDVIVVLI